MRLNELHQSGFQTQWTHGSLNLEYLHEHRHDSEIVCQHARPELVMSLSTNRLVNEATYKEIAELIDGNFLAQKVRADALNGIFFRGFDGDTATFEVNSSEFEKNRIRYRNMIKFDEWEEIGQDSDFKNAVEKARMLLWVGNVRLHCTCPSFLFWGYQYLLSVLDSAIYPEERKPVVRNPRERGAVCKHLNRVLRVLPFYNGEIAREIRNQFGN